MRADRVIRLRGMRVDVGRIAGDVGLRFVADDGVGLTVPATPEQARALAMALMREANLAQFYRTETPLSLVAPDPSPEIA